MGSRADLVALQEADTAVDQVRGRIERLPERVALREAEEALVALRTAKSVAESERQAAETAQEALESQSATLDVQRAGLEAKLRTIIAPREAEALQKEIAGLQARRSALDDQGLELLDVSAEADGRATDAAEQEPAAVERLAAAQAELDDAVATLGAELELLEARRAEAAALVPEALMSRYVAMRRQYGGEAVARLVGVKCTGCHLELSLAEAEQVRHVPDDQLPDCPSCGRILVP